MAIEKSPNILPILGKKIVPSLPKIAKMVINRYIWSHWLWTKKLKLSHARGNVFKIYRKYLNTVGIRIPNLFGTQIDERRLVLKMSGFSNGTQKPNVLFGFGMVFDKMAAILSKIIQNLTFKNVRYSNGFWILMIGTRTPTLTGVCFFGHETCIWITGIFPEFRSWNISLYFMTWIPDIFPSNKFHTSSL